MVRSTLLVAAPLVLLAFVPGFVGAQEQPTPRFSLGGLLFGDLYHVVSHHTEEGEGATGAVVRRGYLTFNADINQSWFGRARLELNQDGAYETYTFDVDFKDLYVGRKFGRHQVLLGLSPTPTFDVIENFWGMRYLMRTPLDLQGVASRDTGISASGPFNASGTLGYRVMVGAGLEFGNESGDGRKIMGAVNWRPTGGWIVDLYADYEGLAGSTDRRTLQVFVGRGTESLRWGVQYSNQDRQEDPPLEVASAFAVLRLSELASLVGRVDRLLEPSPSGDNIAYIPFAPGARATMFNGAVEFRASDHLRVTPNAIVIAYDRNDAGVRPDTDLQLRLTLFVNYE